MKISDCGNYDLEELKKYQNKEFNRELKSQAIKELDELVNKETGEILEIMVRIKTSHKNCNKFTYKTVNPYSITGGCYD